MLRVRKYKSLSRININDGKQFIGEIRKKLYLFKKMFK